MAEEYKNRGLEVLAVNVAGDDPAAIRDYARQRGLKQRFIVNGAELARHYGVRGTPTTIYLDADGRQTARQVGMHSIAAMRKKIEAVLP